jgi:hypothetical protein
MIDELGNIGAEEHIEIGDAPFINQRFGTRSRIWLNELGISF